MDNWKTNKDEFKENKCNQCCIKCMERKIEKCESSCYHAKICCCECEHAEY